MLQLLPESTQFQLVSKLVPVLDSTGFLKDVEYTNGSKNENSYRFGITGTVDNYRFSHDGTLERITMDRVHISFSETGIAVFHALEGPYAGFIDGPPVGELDVADIGNKEMLTKMFERFINEYNSETTTDSEYTNNTPNSFRFDKIASEVITAFRKSAWIYACASAATSNDAWVSYIAACESPGL